jgi:hypothetical protein
MELDTIKIDESWLNRSVEKLRASIHQNKIEEIKYTCVKKDLLVCLCFFSIIEYKKPIENWIKVTEKLRLSGIPFKTISLLFPGQKTKNVDADYWFESDSMMFYKENLYNVIASKEKTFKKICFMDGDLLFDNENWYDDSSRLLESFDVIQPFDTCKWFNKNQKTIKTGQIASSVAVFQEKDFEQQYYHPGFAWCFKRETFEEINGFYDWVSMGEGDMCFVNSLIKNKAKVPFTKSLMYKKYANNVEIKNVKIGFLKDSSAYHLYHGTFKNRSYGGRNKYMPDLICEEPKSFLTKDPEKLMHWKNPKVYNQLIKQYFLDRKEDD